MSALDILEQWVAPITGPLKDFRSATEELATNHQTSVTKFQSIVDDLTNPAGTDAFVGDGANAVTGLMDDYTLSEFALSGTTGALAGPVAEAGGACVTAVTGVGGAVETAAGEVTDTGPLLEVTEVVDVTSALQGGVDVPEDVVAAGLSLMEVLAIVLIIVQLIGLLAFIWFTWQNLMNDIAGRPRPKLPNKPKTPAPPVAFGLTASQQQDLKTLTEEFPNVSPDDIKALLLAGFSLDEIRAILKAGFTHAQIQAVITRIKTAQADQHGTDKQGLTVQQIRALVVKVATAVNSPDKEKQQEGIVARALIADVVSFQRKVYDANGVEIGEIDVETSTAIIEVTTTDQGKRQQVIKEQTDPLINPKGKQVILYAPNYSPSTGGSFTMPGMPDIPIIRKLKDLFDYLRRL
ncbi:MAG: hypothetical protein M3Z08_16780 [Chloroflexota bacterium]|nr:hypothetical protein [Chloroflexota bacterium]